MKLYHGTTKKLEKSIKEQGIKTSDHQNWGMAVSALDSLEKAKDVAGYFGHDGIVLEFNVPNGWLKFHPDYGCGSEFDTIYVMKDVEPFRITGIIAAPSVRKNVRPAGMPLRKWKSQLRSKGLVDENYTIPQLKCLKESDIDVRRLERQRVVDPDDSENKTRHFIELFRSGVISNIDLSIAAVFGNEIARRAAEEIGENPPQLNDALDILEPFIMDRDILNRVFSAISTAIRAELKSQWDSIRSRGSDGSEYRTSGETVSWAIGWIRNSGDDQWRQRVEVSKKAIGEVSKIFGIEWLLDVLRPVLIHPKL